MMNKVTRRLSKMPEEVRGEIAPWFIDRHAIDEEGAEKIIKLDSNAKYVDSDLKVSTTICLLKINSFTWYTM
jgi:fatty acyl-ACP thioesterase B